MHTISSGTLGLEVTNFLPDHFLSFHFDWLRPMGRLFWSMLALTIGLAVVAYLVRQPKPAEPTTWAATILGALMVWIMMTLAYAVIPHEWIIFANSYLNWGSDKFFVRQGDWVGSLPPFDVPRFVVADLVTTNFYIVFAVLNIRLFSMWQKRPVAAPAEEIDADDAQLASTTSLSRLRRRARTSAYGRPVTTSD